MTNASSRSSFSPGAASGGSRMARVKLGRDWIQRTVAVIGGALIAQTQVRHIRETGTERLHQTRLANARRSVQ